MSNNNQTDSVVEPSELRDAVSEALEAWINDPDLHIYIEDGVVTADRSDLEKQLAVMTAATIESMQS
jgi:hypothetical protein